MTSIDDLEKDFNEASFKVILDLQKKNEKLQEENKSLKLLLEGTVPIIQNTITDIGVSNERIVCETQLAILKNSAIQRELTLEEARKLQIYVDTLEKIKEKKDDGIKADISDEQLLQLVKNE